MPITGNVASFGPSDGLPPEVVKKLNHNFWRLADGSQVDGAVRRLSPGIVQDVTYAQLTDKPSIESVVLVDDKLFTDLGIFRTDENGYDVPDDYTLSSMDINALWANAQPIGG